MNFHFADLKVAFVQEAAVIFILLTYLKYRNGTKLILSILSSSQNNAILTFSLRKKSNSLTRHIVPEFLICFFGTFF